MNCMISLFGAHKRLLMIFLNNGGMILMNPLERKKMLKEQFENRKKRNKEEHKELKSFSEFNIHVNIELLKKFRAQRGGVNE